ncbi:hypothetical protein L228DRAFT_61498 [Xylona heveae TC161]|uniref:Uncharacterized protein n=1 Tax=Xylona heveae (strain CBS 132557 / TC161) TaxID=1328760 RepID=A0A165ILR5_XYLHT|nr:hypothetical protein L228DRAFT_61498 [Xylona heveae TC161]KZF25079.1 hypothetical protein L228DRAFT_61498 [Xylona heveae TC161]
MARVAVLRIFSSPSHLFCSLSLSFIVLRSWFRFFYQTSPVFGKLLSWIAWIPSFEIMENFRSPTSISISRVESASLSFFAPRPLRVRKDINARSNSLVPAPLRIVKAKPVDPSITCARVRAISSTSGSSSQDCLELLRNPMDCGSNSSNILSTQHQKQKARETNVCLTSHLDERIDTQSNSYKDSSFASPTDLPLIVRKQRRDIQNVISQQRRSQRDFSSDDCKRVLRLIPSQHFPSSRKSSYAVPEYPPLRISSTTSYQNPVSPVDSEELLDITNAKHDPPLARRSHGAERSCSESSTIHHPPNKCSIPAEKKYHSRCHSEVPAFANHSSERAGELLSPSSRIVSHAFDRISSAQSQIVRFQNGFEPMREHRRSKSEPVPTKGVVEPKKSRAASLRGFLCRLFGRGARAASRARKPPPELATAGAAKSSCSQRGDRKVTSFGQRFLLPPPPPADLTAANPGPTIRVPKRRSNTIAVTGPASLPAAAPISARTRAGTFPQGSNAGLLRVQAEFRADGREEEFVDAALWYLGLAVLVVPMLSFM